MLSGSSDSAGKQEQDEFRNYGDTFTLFNCNGNSEKLEALYNMTAHKAFHFCKQYKRTNEFRRVCDTIRNHLSNLSKYKDQRDRPDITQPDTMQLYLETRFEQRLLTGARAGLIETADIEYGNGLGAMLFPGTHLVFQLATLREYAAEHGLTDEQKAIEAGFAEQSSRFKDEGSVIYKQV